MKPTLSTIVTAVALASAGTSAGPFTVTHDTGFSLRLREQLVLEQTHPRVVADCRTHSSASGLSVRAPGAGMRAEIAWMQERAELTWSYDLQAPSVEAMQVRIPLPTDATVTVVHGGRDKRPQRTAIGPTERDAAMTFSLPRFITISLGDGSGFSVDPLPMGVWGLTGAALDAQDRGTTLRLEGEALVLAFAIPPVYQTWRATLRGKLAVYPAPEAYDDIHPYQYANYRYGFERVVKIAFTTAPMPRKASARRSLSNEPYAPARGYGWSAGAENVTIDDTGVDGKVYGERAESQQPASFRIDAAPGHYYLTLNVGSLTEATGPFAVTVNGETRLQSLSLPKGRFQALPMWVTSTGDHLSIGLSGTQGGAWQLNALTLSALGTLNEDYTLTGSWWHIEP